MTPQTYIFIGRSGCGKGTQVELLKKDISAKDPATPLYHFETGKRFRDFIAADGYTNNLARAIMKSGKRQPDFLAIWMWSHHFIEDLKGGEHIVLDGLARSLNEAKILENAFEFYQRENPIVVFINVSRGWSEKRLLARGRADDVTADIKERLDWYERDVIPAVEYFRTHPKMKFIEVNGEQSVEDVHKELLAKIQ